MIEDAAAEQDADAVAGRALLEKRLRCLTPAERDTFLHAVRRCYASPPPDVEDERSDDGAGFVSKRSEAT